MLIADTIRLIQTAKNEYVEDRVDVKFLVTGGAGFIGSNLAKRLLDLGKVVVVDNLMLGRKENVAEGVEFIRGSVMDEVLANKLVRGCDFVFHEAAYSSSPMFLEEPQIGVHENTIGFMNVMNAAIRHGVRRVIFASTSSMYSGNPTPYREDMSIGANSFYEASFRCREIIAQTYHKSYGLSSVALRYFSVYGPKEAHKGRYANNVTQFLCQIKQGHQPIVYGNGTQTRDFIYVDDVVEANILAMKPHLGFEILNVGTGVGTSFNDLVSLMRNTLGVNIKPTYIKNPVKNYVTHTVADITKIRRMLGFEPAVTLKKGVKLLVEYYKRAGWPTFSS